MTIINIGLLGLGTVGSGIVDLLQTQAAKFAQTNHVQFHLKTVAVAHLARPRAVTLPQGTVLTDDISAVTTDPEIQIVIEVMGTVATAKQAIQQALNNGKSVITANKDLIALAGPELTALAQKNGADLLYEASVAGGIPILRTLSDSLVVDQIEQVTGIINGTTNYILSAMANDGTSYQTALAQAQKLGYAEADPTNDVQGIDATYKLMILSQFAFGQTLTQSEINSQGITQLSAVQLQSAHQLGLTVKHLAIAKKVGQQLYTSVAPMAVNTDSALAQINQVQNAVAIQSTALGETLYTGAGAGAHPTANSVLSDLLVAARHFQQGTRGQAFNRFQAELQPQTLTQVPQAYLISIQQTSNELAIVNEVPTSTWQKQVTGPHYWAGVTSVISPVERQQLLNKLASSGAKAQYLPIANSWQPAPVQQPTV